MNEGYLITLLTRDNITEVELLAGSIKAIDATRQVVAITQDDIEGIDALDQIIKLDGLCDDDNFNYFFSLIHSPFEKTIAFLPDQILTRFNTGVWESLRGLGGVVLPKNRYSFSGEYIDGAAYWRGNIEKKSFDSTSNINAIYINKAEGALELLGFALDICGSYKQDSAIEWTKEKNHLGQEVLLPFFPEYLWSEWVISFIATLNPERIKLFDFVHCIDLSKQEMNHWNTIWSREHWNRFLNYWVTDKSEIKIENFIQQGLVRYQHSGWLTDANVRLLKGLHG
jgi:hypothetical protein